MTSLVVGLGEIGAAVQSVIGSVYSHDTAAKDKRPSGKVSIDIMHVCFPYTPDFAREVQKYMKLYKPEHTVVWSTVPIGTCRLIDERVVHSPVEGIHPRLAKSIKTARRWVGFNDGAEGRFFVQYFSSLGMDVWFVASTETTELVKLRSTAKYGINIVWAEYEAKLCEKFGVSYDQIMAFDRDYNDFYISMQSPDSQRYVLFPPNGQIGGHCLIPNAKMLQDQMPSEFLEKMIAMEKK